MNEYDLLSDNLGKEIYKKSPVIEIEKKFDECFLEFNDYLKKKIDFHARFTKYIWYKERYLFKKSHLVKNDFFDKFHLGFNRDLEHSEELIECLKMFSDYIEYDFEKVDTLIFDYGYLYNFTFKKRK